MALPQKIIELISKRYGATIRYPSDCETLAMEIREVLNENIGVTTLKRLFGFVNDVRRPRLITLDILARYAGFKDYDHMVSFAIGEGDSEFEDHNDIKASDLKPGQKLYFEYRPDRKVTVEYLGNEEFRVIESLKGSLKPGDLLSISSFSTDLPLVVSTVSRDGVDLGRYIAGKISGLTAIVLI